MSKRLNTINGSQFIHMMMTAAKFLHANVENVNALNVFPVPDGDTGTNMNMTLTSGVEELQKRPSSAIGKSADALAKGLLMGARGNSGVILSQLFRGFAKYVHDKEEITVHDFAAALQSGVDTAYKAVVKPVEGTILTVSKEAAHHAVAASRRNSDLVHFMQEVTQKAKEALAKTPDLLPILKQVGVVDAGGQGLVYIYEGFVAALSVDSGLVVEEAAYVSQENQEDPYINLAARMHGQHANVQSQLSVEDIEYGYCTEFMIQLPEDSKMAFEETSFREQMQKFGNSLLVVSDDELVKVHIHAEYPGNVLNYAMKYGELSRIKIDNMRDQHSHLVMESQYVEPSAETVLTEHPVPPMDMQIEEEAAPFGVVTVASGDGLKHIFMSLGADFVLSGGQSMNPSTEDIVNAVRQVGAETVYVLPNNSNIILAAQQAKELVDQQIVVIPSKSIPQGMAALLAFNEWDAAEVNTQSMMSAITQVRTGQITQAVRDSRIDELEIHEQDYLGLLDNKIIVSDADLFTSCRTLLTELLTDGGEVVTIYTGEQAAAEITKQMEAWIQQFHEDVELEIHEGGQPLYPYILSVE